MTRAYAGAEPSLVNGQPSTERQKWERERLRAHFVFSRGLGWLALVRHLRDVIRRPACNHKLIKKSVREAWFSPHPRRLRLDYFVESSGVFYFNLIK